MPEPERHASWLELFFDLVAVAGISQLAHLLRGAPSLGDVSLYALLYLAFWTAWACIVTYGNVTDEESQAPRVLAAMFGLAVMAAAVTEVRSDRAVGLALAYVFVRLVAAGAWKRGQVVVDWPVAQVSAGVIPWVVSLFVGAPARCWLWAAGIGIDLAVMFAVSGQRLVTAILRRNEGVVARHGIDPERLPTPEAVESDVPHLAERLGLYVIIVLGEGIIQVTLAASEVRWDLSLLALTTGAFVLLVGVWALSLVYGFAGVPHLAADVLPARIAMALHCFTTGAIAALGAGLGAAVAHPHGDLATSSRWLLAATVAVYFGISTVTALATHASKRWLVGWALPCTVIPLVLGGFGGPLGAAGVVWALAAVVAWQLIYENRADAAAAAAS